jgi:hypothetical protein
MLACCAAGFAQDNPAAGAPTKTGAVVPRAKAGPKLTEEQMKDLIHVAADKDDENDKKLRDYTYTEFDTEQRLDGRGNVTKTETIKYEVLRVYGEEVQRKLEKDGKPLSAKDAAKEEEKVQKVIDKRKSESDSEREKRLKKEEKDREEGREYLKEITDAYNFTLERTEQINGREAYVIRLDPRPGYVPHKPHADMLKKVRGRVWIDRAESEWVKLDVEVTDTITWGGFLARFHKGTRIQVEQTKVNDDVWLPKHMSAKVDVRLALLKNFDVDVDSVYSDYKKFRTESKVTGMAEAPQN